MIPSSGVATLPVIIQGGMGVAVSNWQLTRTVARHGHLGVVSGTALASVLARRLQDGDPGGHMRRALAHCPLPEAVRQIQARYFLPAGRPPGAPYRTTPLYSADSPYDLLALTIVANFAEVWLAKEGHPGLVGLNLLEKIQLPTLASLYGAMLAGVDFILMGAGIPRHIPGILDRFAVGLDAELRLAIEGDTSGGTRFHHFDPAHFVGPTPPTLRRPRFLAIVSSSTLATSLVRKANGGIDGLVVEYATAGGHNAPPRGGGPLSAAGEPVYGPRDLPDLAAIRALGLPFWLAGSYAHPDLLNVARSLGATGVQIGTAFAYCAESGLLPSFRHAVLRRSIQHDINLRTDPRASPTGLPFKVIDLPGTIADPAVYDPRARLCDLGYLRQPYEKPDGTVGYRCPAEPLEDFLRKGGTAADAVGRKCLCNGLMAAIGLGQQTTARGPEPALLTAGDDVRGLARFLTGDGLDYSAATVLTYVTGHTHPPLLDPPQGSAAPAGVSCACPPRP